MKIKSLFTLAILTAGLQLCQAGQDGTTPTQPSTPYLAPDAIRSVPDESIGVLLDALRKVATDSKSPEWVAAFVALESEVMNRASAAASRATKPVAR